MEATDVKEKGRDWIELYQKQMEGSNTTDLQRRLQELNNLINPIGGTRRAKEEEEDITDSTHALERGDDMKRQIFLSYRKGTDRERNSNI